MSDEVTGATTAFPSSSQDPRPPYDDLEPAPSEPARPYLAALADMGRAIASNDALWPATGAPIVAHRGESYKDHHVWRAPFGRRPERKSERKGAKVYGYSAYDENYRTCGYCGSIHPQDLARLLLEPGGTTGLDGADWKYGWPHKFYVEGIPNPAAGLPCINGSNHTSYERKDGTWGRKIDFIHGTAPATMGSKWYNIHLKDLEGDALLLMRALLYLHTSMHFWLHEDTRQLAYAAPGRGFQPMSEHTRRLLERMHLGPSGAAAAGGQ